MAGSQGDEKGFNPSHKDSFDALYTLARGHATCFLVFFRKNFGSEALGRSGVTALIIMLVVGGLGQIPEMWPFLGVWTMVMLCQRASTMRAKRQGVIRHSRYDGDVDTKLCKNPATVKQFLEPLVCLASAICFEYLGLSHAFVLFVGWGALSLFVVAMIDRQYDNKRLEAMRDAEIEQRYLAARYRGEIDKL
jgi:hypothetical protein